MDNKLFSERSETESKDMIIAILEAGQLEGKMILPEVHKTIEIILPTTLKVAYNDFSEGLKTSPRMRFILRNRISKYKYLNTNIFMFLMKWFNWKKASL